MTEAEKPLAAPLKPVVIRRRRWPMILLGSLLAAGVLLGAGVAWVAKTTPGSGWALRTGIELAGATSSIEGLQGTLADGLSFERLHVDHPSADVDIEGLRVAIDWRALLAGRVHVPTLYARRVRLDLAPSDTPSEPLATLRLPVTVDIDKVAIDALDILQAGARIPVELSDIDVKLALGDQEHRVQVSRLHAKGPQAEATLRGQVRIGVDAPFATELAFDVEGRQDARHFTLRSEAAGSLARLPFSLEGSGGGVEVAAHGDLALLEGFPLRALRLKLAGIDPAAWVPDAPHADLGLTADLTVGAPPAASGDAAQGAGSPWLRGPFALVNATPGAVDKGGIPVVRLAGELALPIDTLGTVDINALEVGLPGGGRLTGTLAWQQATQAGDTVGKLQGALTATEIDASRLYTSALPTRLSGPLSFSADAGKQEFSATLKELGRPLPVSLKLVGRVQEQVLTVSQAELQAGDAKAQGIAELQLTGDRKFKADLRLDRFDPSHFLRGTALPPARVSASLKANGVLAPAIAGTAKLDIDPGSNWNLAPLSGRMDAAFAGERLSRMDADIVAGSNRFKANGAFGKTGDRLAIDLDAPQLGMLWPTLRGSLKAQGALSDTLTSPAMDMTLAGDQLQLPGGIRIDKARGTANIGNIPATKAAAGRTAGMDMSRAPVELDLVLEQMRSVDNPQLVMRRGELTLTGTLASHRGSFDADLTSAGKAAPETAMARFEGAWGNGGNARQPVGWRGALTAFKTERVPFGVALTRPLTLSYLPGVALPQWQWEAGATEFELSLPGGQKGKILHAGSRGGNGRWESSGRVEGLAWAPELLLDAASGTRVPPERIVILDADWNLRFADALQGSARIQRRSGDLWIPGSPPAPMGLGKLRVDLQATPTGSPGQSRVTLSADIEGKRLGSLQLKGEAGVHTVNGALGLDPNRPGYADADINLSDLSWLGLFIGDTMEVGGKIAGKVHIAQEGGKWGARGALDGEAIRVIRVDDGVRLLDGTMALKLEQDRIVLESLRFPGVIRVRPRDSRVTRWLDAQPAGSELVISADWSLSQASGHATIKATRFPAIQRNDRFVAGSGRVDVDLAPTKMRIAGLFEADAGWINLGTQAPPALSDDVLVIRSGEQGKREAARGLTFDIGAKLGDNFYLQGYGLDTALTGEIRVISDGGAMRSSGTVRTRGGSFSTYGQTLTVRRGAFTFQGPIDDPLLDVVALRVGPQVQAGVQVSGTARRPRITLMSEPEVSDVEKLSWLLLGRGPDDGGGSADAGLLISAATSLLGPKGGEPITRQLGIDELGVRSGNVGSTRGLLPERTVAGDSTSSTSQLASQFFIVGKRISDKVYVSFEQALAGRDGVVKLSYKLTDRLSVVGKGGTINGLDLLYMVFFND